MISINNSIFDVKGSSNKDKVFGITLSGKEDVTITNCIFRNIGYSAILNECEGAVTVKDCDFECDGMYNPIEGSQKVNNGNVIVKNCKFMGHPGNNYINFYQMANGSKHEILDCTFEPTVDNNVLRFSNRTSAVVDVLVKDCAYNFADGTPTDYTGLILCQDYTNASGVKQDFTKLLIELNNVVCDGEKVSAEGAKTGCIYYVYEDKKGLITGENDPVIVVK